MRAAPLIVALALAGLAGGAPAQAGKIERLPEAAPVPRAALADADLLRLAQEIADPVAWAERTFAAGRPQLKPSRVLALHRQGVPAAYLDALFEREARAAEADCAQRVAEREKQLARRHDDEVRQLEMARPLCPPLPAYPYSYPHFVPGYPYPGGYYWR